MSNDAFILAGVPSANQSLYHRIRFSVGDSAAYIEIPDGDKRRSVLLVRDIEMDRASKLAKADQIACASDYAPAEGLSGDRDTALAQAAAECLRRAGISEISTDRSLPFIFAWHLQQAGLSIKYDPTLGVTQRRVKTEEEIEHLRCAQAMTEQAMRMACELIARANADGDGVLHHEGAVLTSQRTRSLISMFLLEREFSNHHDSIVVTVPHVADCHHFGDGPLHANIPVIVDIFPRDNHSRYWGDCTRTVVNGQATDVIKQMHAAVLEAKAGAIAMMMPGVTGQQVHDTVSATMKRNGYPMGKPPADADDTYISMRHGTGHGIGLDIHEPILLSDGGEAMLANEVFTVEPGLYSKAHGGVRVEDMVVVRDAGVENLNTLYEGLDWA